MPSRLRSAAAPKPATPKAFSASATCQTPVSNFLPSLRISREPMWCSLPTTFSSRSTIKWFVWLSTPTTNSASMETLLNKTFSLDMTFQSKLYLSSLQIAQTPKPPQFSITTFICVFINKLVCVNEIKTT
ncbi:unnamed protein product [Linum tenue]|uniref:Uncharacterized protein n=1 Tax=Linum tenue TaxID=586396 RepID=A0AAV0LFE7_9ROSI|nr:unnamed protein product [Linum tenue]